MGITYVLCEPNVALKNEAVNIYFHFVHDRVTSGALHVTYVSSSDQLVDVLTKPLFPIFFPMSTVQDYSSNAMVNLEGEIRP